MSFNKERSIQELKIMYCSNSIIQFLVSYTVVLILPLLILMGGFHLAFSVVEGEINESNIAMINHSKSILDIQLSSLESKVLQISENPKICDLADGTIVNSDFFMNGKLAIEEYENLMRYQEVSILKSSYIYMKNSNYVINEGALYKLDNFETYIREKYKISIEEWKNICLNKGEGVPYYANINGHLQYIKPFTTEIKGEVVGVIICNIDEMKLKDVLSLKDGSDERSIFIYDRDKQLIWAEDNAKYKDKIQNIKWYKDEIINNKGLIVVNSRSSITNWDFVIAIPEKMVLGELMNLKNLIIILVILASVVGLILSIYMSVKKGKPINEIFNIFNIHENSKGKSRTSQKLGEMVSEIVRSNAALLEESETEKPMLQQAFLNKLIKGDFVSKNELDILATKLEMKIKSDEFRVVSFRLFLNNDLYEIDSQTMSEVQVLSHLIQNYIIEKVNECVWFYEKDYLTTLAIFHIAEEKDNIKDLVEDVHNFILNQYFVDSTWGISHVCNNVLELWKSCEEASVANSNCIEERIVVYNRKFEASEEFYYPELLEEKIINSIKAADTASIDSILNILYTENYKKRNMKRKMILKLNKRLIATFISNFTISTEIQEKINALDKMIENCNVLEEKYFKYLKTIYYDLCEEFQNKKKHNRNKLIENIVDYINSQYMNSNLGLALVSSRFNISEGYISTIFKISMGVNFADYIEKVRINYACELLKNFNNTINSISEQVGYNSVQSFRRAFKKVKGVSPRELRNKFEEEQYNCI